MSPKGNKFQHRQVALFKISPLYTRPRGGTFGACSGAAVRRSPPQARKMAGDALEMATVKRALTGVDVVTQSLGVSAGPEIILKPTRFLSKATRVLVTAMEEAQVRRLVEHAHTPHDRRPIGAETRATLVAAIADGMIVGTVTSVEQIAARDKCSIRQVNMTISLAQSRSTVHHEGGAGQAAMPGPLVAPG
jgi:hypothetical protein